MIISINAYFLSHQTDTTEDKASNNKLFSRLAYEHFKNTIDMCMMHQDMSVATLHRGSGVVYTCPLLEHMPLQAIW
jgi:hypothetical protein